MSGQPETVVFLGLPRTGKSTYLGTLWQLAQDPAEPTIVERDVTGDRSYLQKLGDQVARGEEIGRTEVSSVEGMRLTLGFEQGDVTVDIPDLGGETLRLLVEDRVWHPRLQDTITASNAMLLFLHPEKLELPMTHRDGRTMSSRASSFRRIRTFRNRPTAKTPRAAPSLNCRSISPSLHAPLQNILMPSKTS